MSGQPRASASYHQAGHVVAAYRLGELGEEDIELLPVGRDDAGQWADTMIAPSKAMTIALAGPATQARYAPLSRVAILLSGGQADYERARATAERMARLHRSSELSAMPAELVAQLTDPEVILRDSTQRAERLVEGDWAAIEALAQALLVRGRLTRAEVGEIIDRAAGRRGGRGPAR